MQQPGLKRGHCVSLGNLTDISSHIWFIYTDQRVKHKRDVQGDTLFHESPLHSTEWMAQAT